MNDIIENPKPVTRHLVPEDQEMGVAEDIFGDLFFLQLEPMIYEIAERIAQDYQNHQFWRYFKLSNGGLYLKPEEDRVYAVSCANGFHGDLSSDALGITACLYAYSHCSFSRDERFGPKCGDHYHLLRSYMMDHAEAAQMTSSCREFSRGT